MVAKRRLDFSRVTDMPTTKRIRRLEAKVRANRPEMRTFLTPFSITAASGAASITVGLTNITQGDNVNNRNGTRIKVWRVEVRGLGATAARLHLIQQHGSSTPVYASYTGDFLNSDVNNTRFTEWATHPSTSNPGNSLSIDGNFKFSRKFKGMVVKYDGSTATPVENGLLLQLVNNSGSSETYTGTVCVWFTDA